MSAVVPAAPGRRRRLVAVGGGARRLRLRRLLVGAPLAAAAALLVLLGLRGSSAFDVETVRVRGVAGPTARVVAEETRRLVGARSLLALDPGALERGLAALPFVRSARVDRAFPHTVAVRVALEEPAAVVVSGAEALTVARSGRVLGRTDARRRRTDLPLLAATTIVERPGARIADPAVLTELAVANAVPPDFGLRLATVQIRPDGLVAETRRGLRIELGDTSDLSAKLLAARAVAVAAAGEEPRLIDVTVPALPAVSSAAPDDATLAGDPAAAAPDGAAPQTIDVASTVGDLFAPVSTSR